MEKASLKFNSAGFYRVYDDRGKITDLNEVLLSKIVASSADGINSLPYEWHWIQDYFKVTSEYLIVFRTHYVPIEEVRKALVCLKFIGSTI